MLLFHRVLVNYGEINAFDAEKIHAGAMLVNGIGTLRANWLFLIKTAQGTSVPKKLCEKATFCRERRGTASAP